MDSERMIQIRDELLANKYKCTELEPIMHCVETLERVLEARGVKATRKRERAENGSARV